MPDNGFYKVILKNYSSFASSAKDGYVSIMLFNACKENGLKVHVYEEPSYSKILGEFFTEELEIVIQS